MESGEAVMVTWAFCDIYLPQLERSSAKVMWPSSICPSVVCLLGWQKLTCYELKSSFQVSRQLWWPLPMTAKTRSLWPILGSLWVKVQLLHLFLRRKHWCLIHRLQEIWSKQSGVRTHFLFSGIPTFWPWNFSQGHGRHKKFDLARWQKSTWNGLEWATKLIPGLKTP